MRNKYFIAFLSIFLGIFFIVSGLGKIVNTAGFVHTLENYGLGYFAYLAPVICVGEIILGLIMILLVNPKKYSMFCFFALLAFTLSFAYGHFAKSLNDCGCFGEIEFLRSTPVVSFIRNILLMVFCNVLYKYSPATVEKLAFWKRNVLLIFISASLILSGFTMSEPIISSVPFENQRIENTELAHYVNTSADSTYLIFVFNYKCPHCWDETENIKSFKEQKIVDRIIGITIDDSVAESNYKKSFNIDFTTINIPYNSIRSLIKIFPTAFIVKNNKVEYVMQKIIHNSFTFCSLYPLMKVN